MNPDTLPFEPPSPFPSAHEAPKITRSHKSEHPVPHALFIKRPTNHERNRTPVEQDNDIAFSCTARDPSDVALKGGPETTAVGVDLAALFEGFDVG